MLKVELGSKRFELATILTHTLTVS